jgi:hypothetical protein
MEGLDTVFRNLDSFADRVLYAVYLVAQEHAADIEAYAKANRTWKDRTGDARKTLHGTARQDEIATFLTIGHGMPYGKWLELANSGKYAILWPTIEADVPEFLRDVVEAIRGMGIKGIML